MAPMPGISPPLHFPVGGKTLLVRSAQLDVISRVGASPSASVHAAMLPLKSSTKLIIIPGRTLLLVGTGVFPYLSLCVPGTAGDGGRQLAAGLVSVKDGVVPSWPHESVGRTFSLTSGAWSRAVLCVRSLVQVKVFQFPHVDQTSHR